MENKINIAELLKDCPTGMELDCIMFDNAYFEKVNENSEYPIRIKVGKTSFISLTKHGCWNKYSNAKCVIFPKGKTTWDGFQRPFKDGDVLATINGTFIAIIKKNDDKYYCCCNANNTYFAINNVGCFDRFATEEEKQKLFNAIEANGYKWNTETKTLEKLSKFKMGDKVKHISTYTSGIVVKVDDKGYYINYPKGEGVCYISFELEKYYELAPNKFDITTLKPFKSRVLIRDDNHHKWEADIFGRYDNGKYITLGGFKWIQCIPYKNNEHLFGTTNDCDDFYKTWEE